MEEQTKPEEPMTWITDFVRVQDGAEAHVAVNAPDAGNAYNIAVAKLRASALYGYGEWTPIQGHKRYRSRGIPEGVRYGRFRDAQN